MATNSTLTSLEIPSSLNREFIELTARNAQRMPLPAFITCLFIALLAYQSIPGWIVGGWLVLVAMMLFSRIKILTRLPEMHSWSEEKRVRIIIAMNILGGVLQGGSLLFFPFMPMEDRAFQTLLIIALATGVVNSTMGFPVACVPYLLLTLVPLSLCWALFPISEQGLWKDYFLAALGMLFTLIIYSISKETYKLFTEAIRMRSEHAELNKSIATALDESERSNAAKTRFLASASHDLRQPVHTLSLLTGALMMRKLDPQTDDISATLNETVKNLSSQLDALLDISKLDAGIVKPRFDDTDVVELTRRLCNEFRPQATEKDIELKFVSDPAALAVTTDPTLLESIMRNLVSNAIKYTDEGSILIELTVIDNTTSWTITDTGIGIKSSEHNLVFDEFYQLNNPARDRARGLGLGLSIVKRLTALLQLQMNMDSSPGMGTRFTLTLPLTETSDEFERSSADELVAIDLPFQDAVVLVVDDDVHVRQATSRYLSAMNCKVHLADGYNEALAIAGLVQPDLLIVDFRLNDGTNGLQVQKALRQKYPALPTLMITGDTAPARLQEASEADVTLMHKPLDGAKLQQAMVDVLNLNLMQGSHKSRL